MKIGKVAILAAALLVAACQGMNNEQQGGLIGAGAGAVGGGLLGHALGGGAVGTILGAGLGGLAGWYVGTTIGKSLDEQERQRASAATKKLLQEPVKQQNGRVVAKAQNWKSPDRQDVRGHSEITEVSARSDGAECRTVHEVAYIHGEEKSQNTRYCRSASGNWEATAT